MPTITKNIRYVHVQDTPSSTWVINHGLGYHPPITTVDSAGNVVWGDVLYNDENSITLSFSSSFGGRAFLGA